MNVGLVGGAELAGWLAVWLIYSVSLGLQTDHSRFRNVES